MTLQFPPRFYLTGVLTVKFFQMVILALFAGASLFFVSGCDKHAQDRAAIHMVIDKLVTAREGGDGETYAGLLANDNLEYYGRTQKLILTGKKADIMALPFHQRYEILLVRLMGKRKEMKDLDAKGYVAWFVKNGLNEYMLGPNADLDIGHLTFRKDEAYCDLTMRIERKRRGRYGIEYTQVKEQPTQYSIRFCLEGGQWKFDTSTFDQGVDLQIQEEIRAAGVEEDRALLYLLGVSTGEEVPPTIWNQMMH